MSAGRKSAGTIFAHGAGRGKGPATGRLPDVECFALFADADVTCGGQRAAEIGRLDQGEPS